MTRKISGVIFLIAMMAVSLPAQPLTLKSVVTPSTVIVKDGKPVTFAIHGFIEFKSLAEAFGYIEAQTKRWNGPGMAVDTHRLAQELLREAVESRVVSMVDERPLEALVTHTSERVARGDCAGEGTGAAGIRGSVSGGAGKMEACVELLERFAGDCGEGAFELVSD